MWVASRHGWFSIVVKTDGTYHVRARRREDLVRLAEAGARVAEARRRAPRLGRLPVAARLRVRRAVVSSRGKPRRYR